MKLSSHLVKAVLSENKVSPQGWYQGTCPFCGGIDKFGIHLEYQRFTCLKCGSKGALSMEQGKTFRPPPLPVKPAFLEEVRPAIEIPPDFVPFSDSKRRKYGFGKRVWEYATGRGLSEEVLLTSGMGYIDYCEAYAYRKRLVIPVWDTQEKHWLGFVSRKIETYPGDPWKYLNNPGFERSHTLYNSKALLTPSDTHPIWVVEGAADALWFYPHGVAVFGTYSEYQVQVLVSVILNHNPNRPVIVVLDGDAHRLALRFALRLQEEGIWAGCVRLPAKKDPDNMQKQWLYEEAYRSLEQGLY